MHPVINEASHHTFKFRDFFFALREEEGAATEAEGAANHDDVIKWKHFRR